MTERNDSFPHFDHSHIGRIGRCKNGVRFAVTGELYDGTRVGPEDSILLVLILRGPQPPAFGEATGRTIHASHLLAPITWEDE